MSAEIQVSRKLNEIINSLTDQSSIRTMQLKRLPLCIFYGEMPEELRQLLQTELLARIGGDYLIEFVSVLISEEMETAVKTAVRHFQEKAENGMIPKIDQIYVPVFFMANQVEATKLISSIQRMDEIMCRFGFEEEYEVGFYCVFDYEEMEGNACKEQLELLQKDKKCKFPMGVFTQDNMVRTVEQKYLKATQAIAIHIFLQCSLKDIVKIEGSGSDAVKYTLGYWKLDVLKQKIVEYLLEIVDNQNRQLITEGDYYEQIGTNLEIITDVDLDRYQKMFMHMPVRKLKLTGKHYYTHELMFFLYEDTNAFYHFLMENVPDIGKKEYVEAFLQKGVGNIYAVTEQLEGVLIKRKEIYSKEKDKLSAFAESQGHMIRITRGIKLVDIIGSLCNYCWVTEGEIFQLERRISFIDAIIACLHSQEFTMKKNKLSLQNRNCTNRLKMIKGESLLPDRIKIDDLDCEASLENYKVPEWEMDLLSPENFQNVIKDIDRINAHISSWTNENAENMLAHFAAGLGELKRRDAMKSYYATRLDIPKKTYEKEFLFLGKSYQKFDMEELRRVVSTQIPRIEIKRCDWETETCLECFTVKEIEDLSEIYGID